MLGCDVVAIVLLICLVLPVDSSCDADADTAKLYREKFCNLTKIVGSCKLKWKRFYFNRSTRQCEQFVYEGNVLID